MTKYRIFNDLSKYIVWRIGASNPVRSFAVTKINFKSESLSLNSLADQLFNDTRLNELEKCVVLLQMYTYVGSDQYYKAKSSYRDKCSREDSENFI